MLPHVSKIINLAVCAFVISSFSAKADQQELLRSLQNSDDYEQNIEAYVAAAERMIELGICTMDDFSAAGGWIKASGANQNRPIYFTYCGSFTISGRWYLNVADGRFYQ